MSNVESTKSYQLWVDDHGASEFRAELAVEFHDARRIAQALANTEDVEVAIVPTGTITQIERARPDENQYPHVTLAEQAQISTVQNLRELIADAEHNIDAARERYQILIDELKRRLGK